MNQSPCNFNRLFANELIATLIKMGSTHFFTSPGHRNAPLLWAIQNNTNNYSINIDERSSAYEALGFSKASDSIPVLCCTSGTALANYFPAVIEAHHSKIPLIIISADRPKKLHNKQNNQTTNQINIYSEYCSFFKHENNLNRLSSPEYFQFLAKSLYLKAYNSNLPVHLNIEFDDPLDQTIQDEINKIHVPKFTYSKDKNISSNKVQKFKCDLLVVGEVHFKNRSYINKVLENYNGDVYCDITSSLSHFTNINTNDLGYYEHVIHIGGKVLDKNFYKKFEFSKLITLFQQDENYIHDPSDVSDNFLKVDFENLVIKNEKNPTINNSLKNKTKYYELLNNSDRPLFIGNSSIIRDINETSINIEKNLFFNRGVSGIEGNISTALGISTALNTPVDVVLGDISFLYDLSCLSLLESRNIGIRIFLINNRCGGIFKRLPISKEKETNQIIQTPHNFNFEYLGNYFDKYLKVNTINKSILHETNMSNKNTLIEVIDV